MQGGLLIGGMLLAGCSTTPPDTSPAVGGSYKVGQPYQVSGRWYYPAYDPDYAATGVASWYGAAFHGRRTANGEVFDRNKQSAAHPTLPLPSIVRVTNLANQRQLELRVNDRGPFVGDRVIDLSQAAARALGFERRGTTQVRVEFVRLADGRDAPAAAASQVAAVAGQEPGSAPRPSAEQVVALAKHEPRPLPRPSAAQIVALAKQDAGAPPQPVVKPVVMARADPRPSAGGRLAVLAAARPLATERGDTAKRCRGVGFIQVGAFIEPERALRLARQLDGAIALPVSAELPSVDRFARVRLGPIGDQRQAEAALLWLHQSGHGNAFLIKSADAAAAAC